MCSVSQPRVGAGCMLTGREEEYDRVNKDFEDHYSCLTYIDPLQVTQVLCDWACKT
jgi:hypothetical protein